MSRSTEISGVPPSSQNMWHRYTFGLPLALPLSSLSRSRIAALIASSGSGSCLSILSSSPLSSVRR